MRAFVQNRLILRRIITYHYVPTFSLYRVRKGILGYAEACSMPSCTSVRLCLIQRTIYHLRGSHDVYILHRNAGLHFYH